MTGITTPELLSPKDYASDQDVRWCPGCGDYSILAQMKKVLAALGVPREKIVFVSGIGCSSRFPYYMNAYGFHTIHGRALPIATGVKIANPELTVWVVTGDGDGLSIGGNHLLHAIRRNLDINILLFNNRIYGLTKGQYSPTSPLGKKTKSTPVGSIDFPLHPISVAIGAEATFVARTIDVSVKHLASILDRAAKHKGTSFVEIYQNCPIFNDQAFEYATGKDTKEDTTIFLEHNRPLVFGKERKKGIRPHILDTGIVVPEGLRERSGRALVSRMWGLLHPRANEKGLGGAGRAQGEDRVRVRHWLLEPFPLLHERLRIPHHSRTGLADRNRRQDRKSGAHRLGCDR